MLVVAVTVRREKRYRNRNHKMVQACCCLVLDISDELLVGGFVHERVELLSVGNLHLKRDRKIEERGESEWLSKKKNEKQRSKKKKKDRERERGRKKGRKKGEGAKSE